MKTITEITNIISTQLGEVSRSISSDYEIVVCPERIFVDDYLPAEVEFAKRSEELESFIDESEDMPYKNKIFIVVKMGGGQQNMAVSSSPATIQVLSEENDFVMAREILDQFIAKYNFEYVDGIIQSYFTPENTSSLDEVYTGFRCLCSIRGTIKVPEDGLAFSKDIIVSLDGTTYFKIPFIGMTYRCNAQPDPRSFAGYGGETVALNRQVTKAISIETYLWDSGAYKAFYDSLSDEDKAKADADPLSVPPETTSQWVDLFSSFVLEAQKDMNRRFHICIRSSIEKSGYEHSVCEAGTESYLPITDGCFILTDVSYSQEWGDVSVWSLSFTKAAED